MKLVLLWVLGLWTVSGINLSRSESFISYLDEEVTLSHGSTNSLMVPLILIQGAAPKGAGNSLKKKNISDS